FVEVEVEHAPAPGAHTPGAPAGEDVHATIAAPPVTDLARAIRVAVGLVHLTPVSTVDTARGVRIRFEPPAPLRPGLHVLFLAFGPDDRLDQPRSDFKLHAIRWR